MYSIPYLIVFFFIFICVVPFSSNKNTLNKTNISFSRLLNELFVFILLVLFLGFRGFIFTDYISYYPFFDKIPSAISSDFSIEYFKTNNWEIGYLFYALICKTIFPNYIFFQFLSTIIDLFLFHYTIKLYIPKSSHVLVYALFFAFYGLTIEVNLLRNSKAILFYLLALKYVNKSFIKYFFFCAVACLFHKWSIIYIPLYFVLGKKWNRKVIFLLWVVGNIICIFQVTYLKNLFLSVTSTMSSNVFIDSVKYYLNSSRYSVSYSLGFGWFERFISFFLIFYFSEKTISNNAPSNIFLNISYIYFFMWLYFTELSIFIQRFTLLFVFGFWFTMAFIYAKIPYKVKRIWLLYLFFISVLKIFIAYNQVIFNYKFIFFDDFGLRQNIFLQNKSIF